MARRGERGFSLIEIVTSLGVATTVSTVILGSLVMYQQNSTRELDFTQAQQNARASLAILEHYTRQAGFGFAAGLETTPIPIGACSALDGVTCNAIDSGSDRVRISGGDSSYMGTDTAWAPGNSMIRMQPKATNNPCPAALAAGTKLAISGTCSDGTRQSDVLTIGADVNDGQYCHKYHWSGTPSCNYDSNLTIESTLLRETDFYISRTDPLHPTLMMDPDGSGAGAGVPVAYDIDDLQIQYGIDTTMPDPDRVVELWCDDLTLTSCNTGFASPRANQARVIAVRIAVVARTPSPEAGYMSPAVSVFGHSIAGGDGYVRWVYRTVIRLRSINL